MVEIAESLKNVIATDFQYFKIWYDFSFNVEKYLPTQEFEKVFSVYDKNIFNLLLTSRCAQTDVRRNLLKVLGLKDSVDYDVCARPVKLVIRNKDRLIRTMHVAGAIFHYKDIIKIINKNELNALVEFIGQDIYSFIVKRGMVLWKMLPDLKVKTVKMPLVQKITSSGKCILGNALVGLPDEVKKRLELMLGEQFDIPSKYDETVANKSLELIEFSLEKLNDENHTG
ncbi:MAG: SctK family type III secretion system sorting platform protein [Puniceicoccales bacterium]|jgi:hypothetical protein|nr:SctK family type III secretion system sorting platform protein [Puniceicoccales bacterium]MDR1233483.1 SctK family type III secretion system sorting platform protein [Puniceicoccales bacterium]